MSLHQRPQSLCVSCQSLQLTPRDFEPSFHTHGRHLFSRVPLSNLLKSSESCALCRLFIRTLHIAGVSSTNQRTCSARIAGYNHQSSRNLTTIRICTDDKESHEGHLLPVQRLKNGEDGFLGRIVQLKAIDINLVKRWIGKCMLEHGDACSEHSNIRPFHTHIQEHFLVIDVLEGNLAYPKAAVRYLALSYVWGRKSMPLLTKQVIQSWRAPNGLSGIIPKLPKTIQDAIHLTQILGERYLWVDSLCVIQDDMDFKAKLINKMNLIYENAFITIFAAAGPDADSGLPGIRPWSRNQEQPFAAINNKLSLIYPFSHSSLRMSVWASRGWTLQEWYFSKRRLIFNAGMMFFRCARSTWREDLCLEERDIEIAEYDMATGFKDSIEKWEPTGMDGTRLEKRKRYFSVVYAYLRRQLTYETDILDAIAGIHDHFGEQAGLKIHYGIPIETFGCDIFWRSGPKLERRLPYPSWSWVGWKGEEIRFNAIDAFVHQDRVHLDMSKLIPWYIWKPENDGFEEMWTDLRPSHHRSNSLQGFLGSAKSLMGKSEPRSLGSDFDLGSIQTLSKAQLLSIGTKYKSQALKAPGAVMLRTLTAIVVLSQTQKESKVQKITESVESLPSIPWFGSLARSKTETEQILKPLGHGKLDHEEMTQTIWRPIDLPESKFNSISGKRVRVALISGPLRPCLNESDLSKTILRMLLLYELPTDQMSYILAERIGLGEIWVDCLDVLDFEETNIILH